VVARYPLEHPEQPRVVAAVEAIRDERGRLGPLHVPRMEVLVAREREEALVLGRHAGFPGLRQIVAIEDQARRRAMLEAAVAVADGKAEEPVPIERRRPAEEVDLRLAELAEVRGDSLEIRIEAARDHEPMRNAGRVEVHALEAADLERMIDQLVVALGAVAAETALVDGDGQHRGCDAPILAALVVWRLELELDRLAPVPLGDQEQARAVEVRAAPVEVSAAHGLIERVNLDRHDELPLGAAKPPRGLVRLLRGQRAPAALAADRDDMPRELAQQIAARNPRRHPHAFGRRRIVDPQLDLEQMAARIEQPNAIVNQSGSS